MSKYVSKDKSANAVARALPDKSKVGIRVHCEDKWYTPMISVILAPLSDLAEGIDPEGRGFHQLVRRDALGLPPLEEVLAFRDQNRPLGECPSGVFARSGRHARRLEGAVVPDVFGRTGLQGELGWKRKLGRIEPSISTCRVVDVLIYPFERDFEG